jgi:hypothetical protein
MPFTEFYREARLNIAQFDPIWWQPGHNRLQEPQVQRAPKQKKTLLGYRERQQLCDYHNVGDETELMRY